MCRSDTKFNSHCGWPAFSAAKKVESKPDGNVARNVDMSHGMIRTEVTCAKVRLLFNIISAELACALARETIEFIWSS